MTNPFSSEISFIAENSNGTLTNFPKTDVKSIVFDGTDATIFVYVDQFRCFLRACGFSEANIVDAMGEE
jgi:hypothetical protein